jgi:(R)-citramalate synthase
LKEKIYVMDTTLRDGEQTHGVVFTPDEKISIARALHEAGADFIEIGSAFVSEGERKGVETVVENFSNSGYQVEKLECLVYLTKESVDWAHDAGIKTVNILSKGSSIQTRQLKMTPEEHERRVLEIINYVKSLGMTPNLYLEHFSSEGGIREDPNHVESLIKIAMKACVGRITFCDTLGLLDPESVRKFVRELVGKYPSAFFDFHGHNDYGLAAANSIAAVESGCRGVQVTINGLGERAGNAALHRVIVGINDFTDKRTDVREDKIYPLSKMVERFSGFRIPSNEPIIGSNAFIHKSGIHVDGMVKGGFYAGRLRPERFGRMYEYSLGKHSGKATIRSHLESLGVEPTTKLIDEVLKRVKDLSDKKEIVTSEDLSLIVNDILQTPEMMRIEITKCVICTGKNVNPEATVHVRYKEKTSTGQSAGNGGYDASMKALAKALEPLGLKIPHLVDYSSSIPPGGKTDALVSTTIVWKDGNGNEFKTVGTDSDQTVSAIKATEKMLNRILEKSN